MKKIKRIIEERERAKEKKKKKGTISIKIKNSLVSEYCHKNVQ